MKHKHATMLTRILSCLFISIGLITSAFIFSCGIIAPNVATLVIRSDSDNITDGYTGVDLKAVIVNYNTKKKANINKGEEKTFQIEWWGENQQSIPISYYTESNSGLKTYKTDSFMIRNFDNMKIHVGYNALQGPQVEKNK